MRIAGENAYAKLLDFTTTVSWRPRYFSYYCWSLQRAFEQTRERDVDGWRVDDARRARLVKRRDYWMVAASIAADPHLQRVAGSDKLSLVLKDEPDDSVLTNRADHL